MGDPIRPEQPIQNLRNPQQGLADGATSAGWAAERGGLNRPGAAEGGRYCKHRHRKPRHGFLLSQRQLRIRHGVRPLRQSPMKDMKRRPLAGQPWTRALPWVALILLVVVALVNIAGYF